MASPDFNKYIPTGSLYIRDSEVDIPAELWNLPDLRRWHRFDRPANTLEPKVADHIFTQIQEHLMASPSLRPYSGLFRNHWIDLEFCVSFDDPSCGIVRVYILPDDVDRRLVDRSDQALRKARRLLFANLDFSPSAWHGKCRLSRSLTPRPFHSTPEPNGPATDDGEASLLHMFNNLPSPDPHPGSVEDGFARYAMCNLLNSDVPGLISTLHPYQRRSAALMLQRESQPGQVLDPRLLEVTDQRGDPWFYDYVNGWGRRESRTYEDVRGGILAEQMGSGKTLMCLALILATKDQPAKMPDIYQGSHTRIRPKIGSLSDMAAACITNNSVPWKLWFGAYEAEGIHHTKCVEAIQRNPAWYLVPPPPPGRRARRQADIVLPPKRVFLSNASLIIVPANLVQQWKQEISKHTTGLKTLIITRQQPVPPVVELLQYDIILFSSTRFERLEECLEPLSREEMSRSLTSHFRPLEERDFRQLEEKYDSLSHLESVHFKRCIVDEGHKLGNSRMGSKSNLLRVIDRLQFSARWIVTGTPSKGLFGVDTPDDEISRLSKEQEEQPGTKIAESSSGQEKDDLQRIGAIATLYLKARPWANSITEGDDAPADWSVYVMQPRHSNRSSGRKDCLKNTLEALIIRHRLSEIGDLLPPVDEKIVYLDGSYQDKLALNLFSMMIIFNAVQSQRTDMDYFFHRRQRKALQELVSNLRQASFFGGSFFSASVILKAVETAEKFLEEGKVAVSTEDESILREAIAFGHLALGNGLKEMASLFRELPLYVSNFPGGLGEAWSLDLQAGDPVCTDARLILSLQKFLRPCIDAPNGLRMLFENGKLKEKGFEERAKFLEEQLPPSQANGNATGPPRSSVLAGNTMMGEDHNGPKKRRSSTARNSAASTQDIITVQDDDEGPVEVAEPLARTQIISTASAKLSYLIDAIAKHQVDEQIIVFYENENVAYYLASVLEILQIHHLIYAKSITPERRSQYVATFNHNPKFRVLLMDITQAAFGLDMRSASRIYFINPVLNPQVEAQAVGRARRISQHRRVTVETLVLRGSLEEVIVARKGALTLAEHHKLKNILDDRPIYDWILNARISPLPDVGGASPTVRSVANGTADGKEADQPSGMAAAAVGVSGVRETALLATPLYVFGAGAGREAHPDEDLVMGDDHLKDAAAAGGQNGRTTVAGGMPQSDETTSSTVSATSSSLATATSALLHPLKRKVRFSSSGTTTPVTVSSRATPVRFTDGEAEEQGDDGSVDDRPARRVRFAGPEDDD